MEIATEHVLSNGTTNDEATRLTSKTNYHKARGRLPSSNNRCPSMAQLDGGSHPKSSNIRESRRIENSNIDIKDQLNNTEQHQVDLATTKQQPRKQIATQGASELK